MRRAHPTANVSHLDSLWTAPFFSIHIFLNSGSYQRLHLYGSLYIADSPSLSLGRCKYFCMPLSSFCFPFVLFFFTSMLLTAAARSIFPLLFFTPSNAAARASICIYLFIDFYQKRNIDASVCVCVCGGGGINRITIQTLKRGSNN